MDLPSGDEFLRRYPRQLSVGQAQRVAIAMAVMHHPQLLIADEPTSALDPSSRTGILDLFESLNRNLRLSILYISHDLSSVDRLCHRVIELSPSQRGVAENAEETRSTPSECLLRVVSAPSATPR